MTRKIMLHTAGWVLYIAAVGSLGVLVALAIG